MPWLVHRAALDCGAAVVEAERTDELVERRSAEAHVARDIDRTALAAPQRLLQVDADDAAVGRLERRRPGQGGDGGGGRRTGGVDGKSRRASPGRDGSAEIGERRAEIGVGKFAARAELEVLPDAGEAGFAVEASAIHRRFDERRAEPAVLDDQRTRPRPRAFGHRGRGGRRRGASRDRRSWGGASANGFMLQPPDRSNRRCGGPSSGSSANVSAASVPETVGRPAGSAISIAPSNVCSALVIVASPSVSGVRA